jgi:hypothetical protein
VVAHDRPATMTGRAAACSIGASIGRNEALFGTLESIVKYFTMLLYRKVHQLHRRPVNISADMRWPPMRKLAGIVREGPSAQSTLTFEGTCSLDGKAPASLTHGGFEDGRKG